VSPFVDSANAPSDIVEARPGLTLLSSALAVPNLTMFVETGSHGPGFNLAARLNNSDIQTTYTRKEMKAGMVNGKKTYWTLKDVFGEDKPKWVDWSYVGSL